MSSQSVLALVRANLRYWSTVAPVVRRQLARWEDRAEQIDHPQRRLLALEKLRVERFNPRLAATLATLAPRARRRDVTEAIVALQVAYDYLDALGERSHDASEDSYVQELLASVRARTATLAATSAVEQTALVAAERCKQAQRHAHLARGPADTELRVWATSQAGGTSLGWVEWLAGAQASVLAVHALIAAAANPATTSTDAQALDRAYLRIGAVTMLDSLIDHAEDRIVGAFDYVRLYPSKEEMGQRLAAVVCQATEEILDLPDAAHHLMTLSGVVAFYASAPAARQEHAAEVFAHVRSAIGPSLLPSLLMMRTWRLAARIQRPNSRQDRARAQI